MTFKIVVARGRSNDPEVHKDGCADIKRSKYTDVDRIEVSEVEDAARWFWEDFLAGGCAYGESDPDNPMTDDEAQQYTKYHACTKGLPTDPARQELYEWFNGLNDKQLEEILPWMARNFPEQMETTRKAFTP
jgi:hypothetical protein